MNWMDFVMSMSKGVYVLWAVGLLGVFLKVVANTYLNQLLQASSRMATTKNRSIRIMKQKFENGRTLGMNKGLSKAFTEKYVESMRCLGFPFLFWKRIGYSLVLACVALMGGAFLYYDERWRGSPDMVVFLANGAMICAFLASLENIFLTENKVDRLKANIQDYFDNYLTLRSEQQNPRLVEPACRECACGKADGKADGENASLPETKIEKEDACIEEVPTGKSPGDGEVLNSFLREFFT